MTSINRGMKSLGATMSRRGLGYVVGLTLIVTFAGAAGIMAFEQDGPAAEKFDGYGSSLWWTAMLMTTMGSEAWPQTAEGRLLCLILAVYAFAVFGYVAGAIASYFVGQDASDEESDVASSKDIKALREEIAALRKDLESVRGLGTR